MTAPALSMKELRRVVIAAAVGNVIEWYDFYIFGSLAALLSVKFFEQGPGGGALIRTVGTFTAWGWRIPFLLSLLMVAIAIYIRLQLQETPIFQAIKAKGQTSSNPWREAFWSQNIRYVLIASIVVIGEGVVWYSGQFWALYFIQQVGKPEVLTPAIITGIALLIAPPTLIFFGWLSDKVGRKPIILAGFALAALTYYPLYTALGQAADPANTNYPLAILIVAIMVSYVGMVYGPIGAFLAEYFPARIRYSSVSVPYHIGNGWGGGLGPVITTAAYGTAHTAGLTISPSLGHAPVYPIAVPAGAFPLRPLLMPETRKISIWKPEEVGAARV